MSFLLPTHYRIAYDSITRNRTRSFLTCLGIGIGVGAIILILSLMGSIQNLVSSQVASAGSDLIVVRPSQEKDTLDNVIDQLTSSNQYLKSNLSLKDVTAIKKIPGVAAAAPISKSSATISAERVNDAGENYTTTISSASIIATNSDLIKTDRLTIASGSFINTGAQENTTIIGHDLSLALFGSTEPVGKTFTLYGHKFIVTGILSKINDPINFNSVDFDNSLLVNADYIKSLDENVQIQQINVKTETANSVPSIAEDISSTLSSSKSGDKNFSVAYGDQISHPANELLVVISGMLTIVAGVSLIVGGIGVMNIMLVSVAERTHEIGIRKAVGATSGNILLQFLFESLILSSLGGILGLILGYVAAFLVSVVTPFSPYIDFNILGITLATSVSIGIIFGIYPAAKAAHKNPIDSLRYYR